ncbi:MAG: alanine racemase [Candidatus Eisenbacteria bacterium]|uniref:Alanine racemase n=1 Tax=Eiseniibacteriota bacterium TaxID=2212470 RepID=A0A956NGR0_UNCEI|nr:alanine racemase [Candidatus Eisenbacteria bacterium]
MDRVRVDGSPRDEAGSPGRRASHSSRIELSEAALRKNLSFLRERVGPGVILSSVVKANAYGHGIDPFVLMAERLGVRHFSVASSFEASSVLEVASPDTTILIMGILYSADLPWVIERGIEFYVFDVARLEEAARVARTVGRPAHIHLEVETGGNRLGLPMSDLDRAISILKKEKAHLRFVGLCTHFAGIESLSNQFRIQKQLRKFDEISKRMRTSRCLPEIRHTACSAAALGFPETVMDMVRVGTAQYGMWPSPDIMALVRGDNPDRNGLSRVLTWKTDIMHLKPIKEDEFVGYGTSYQAPADMIIAVLPVGYGNGLPRGLSNRGHVLVRGRKAPIIGLVNMNACMVDVTHIPGAEVGDEVVLVGKQKNNTISIRSFSEFTNVLNNEFVSRLPPAIPRVVVR